MIYRLAVTLTVLGFLVVVWLLKNAVRYSSFALVGEAAGVLTGAIFTGIVAIVLGSVRHQVSLRRGWRQTRRVV